MISHPLIFFFFFFNDTATTEIYTLSLHDALPICRGHCTGGGEVRRPDGGGFHQVQRLKQALLVPAQRLWRSEEHTSELQSPCNLVCRLLLEKKKKKETNNYSCTINIE